MPLEIGNTIESLDASWPLGGDPHNKGDDHMRLIKHVLKTQFPGIDLGGFKIPIIATEQEINWLTGLSSNAQAQFDAITSKIDDLGGSLSAAPGTYLSFYQAAPPLGWTIDGSIDGSMMRVVTSTGGGSGGSDNPILNDKVPSHVHNFSGSTNSGGVHSHLVGHWTGGGTGLDTGSGANFVPNSMATSSAGAHTHSISGATADNSGASDWAPKYIDVIVAVKD